MKCILIKCILIIIIIILLIIFFYSFYNKLGIDTFLPDSKYNIGNELGEYFIDIAKSILNNTDFNYDKYNNDVFFKDLRNNIKKEEFVEIYNKFKQGRNGKDIIDHSFLNSINYHCIWTVDNTTSEYFWLCMKPLINSIYKTAFIKNNLVKKVNKTVIHFRCADIPFIRQKKYHFQKYKFFKDALNSISTLNKQVMIIYNNSHHSNVKNSQYCDIYVESLIKYLRNLGYTVIIQSESQLDDFATIFYAPAIISTSSSYSFMSGFFGDGKFISASHYEEDIDKKCNNCEWQYHNYELEHKDVLDYYNSEQVIKKLNNSSIETFENYDSSLIVSKLSNKGFYAMLRCTLNHYLYCKKNKINFKINSNEWLYKVNNGWTDYFDNTELNFNKIDNNRVKEFEIELINTSFTVEDYRSALKEVYRYNKNTINEINIVKTKYNLVKNTYDSIYIRRGDKLASESVLTDEYIYIELLLKKNPTCKIIFLQTDDYTCFINLLKYIDNNNLNIKLITTCDENNIGAITNNDYKKQLINSINTNEKNKKYFNLNEIKKIVPISEMNKEQLYSHTMELICGIDIIINSNICICNRESNVSRIIKMAHNVPENVYDIISKSNNDTDFQLTY